MFQRGARRPTPRVSASSSDDIAEGRESCIFTKIMFRSCCRNPGGMRGRESQIHSPPSYENPAYLALQKRTEEKVGFERIRKGDCLQEGVVSVSYSYRDRKGSRPTPLRDVTSITARRAPRCSTVSPRPIRSTSSGARIVVLVHDAVRAGQGAHARRSGLI